jgi:hypothetical protein
MIAESELTHGHMLAFWFVIVLRKVVGTLVRDFRSIGAIFIAVCSYTMDVDTVLSLFRSGRWSARRRHCSAR